MFAAHRLAQGHPAAGPSPHASHGDSSMGPTPRSPQAPSPASSPRGVHVRDARSSHAPLHRTQATLKLTPMVHPRASDAPSVQASP